MEKQFIIHSLDEINNVAHEFIQHMGDNRIFAFNGKMGVGKTTFIKAICDILNVKDNVCSPTFAIVNVYESPVAGEIYHFDFYRLNDPYQALDIGIEEYFDSGNYCFLEWSENIAEFIPQNCIFVEITQQNDQSRVITAHI